jgi:hypothetical protein
MNISIVVNTFEPQKAIQNLLSNLYTGVLQRVIFILQLVLHLALAIWITFLSAGLLISIFGANLEQQKYASVKKIDANEYIFHACQSKSISGIENNLDNKLMPDFAQCLGNKIFKLIK